MLKIERQKNIMTLLQTKGSVTVDQLTRIFNVTDMTIRRDLEELSDQHQIIKTHGGATLAGKNVMAENPFELRINLNMQQKVEIAHAALELIEDGQKIFFDSGTSTFLLAKILDNSKNLIVVTNAINIATELNLRNNIKVMPIGGELRKNTYSCTGYFAEQMIRQIKVDMAFVGVSGIGIDGELYNQNVIELGIKEAIVKSAKRCIVLADHSKLGVEEFVSYSNLRYAEYLITDSLASEKILQNYRELGIKIKIADSRIE
jgi:DeoR family transcriptional regulator, fructose operon transcriptional repressor